MSENIKIKVGQKLHPTDGFTAIVDVKTNGKEFYEEVQYLERARRFVRYWNSHEALLAACEAWKKACYAGEIASSNLSDDSLTAKAIKLTQTAIAKKGA